MAELLLRDRLIRKIEKRYSPEPIVLDGSPLINLGAWTTLYKADLDENAIGIALKVINGRDISASEQISIRNKLPELFILRSLGLAHMQLPQAALFLDVAPAVCVERIRRRGGALQVHETEERLTDLRRGYVVCCSALRKNFGLRIAVVRGNGDRESAAKAANDLASELL